MDPIGMKDQVQFAHVLETLVEGLDKDLDQIENAQIGFLCVDGKYKIQGGIISVDELDVLAPLRNDALEVVAKGVGPGRHLREDPPYHALLDLFRFDGLVEFYQPGFPVVVDNNDSLDHGVPHYQVPWCTGVVPVSRRAVSAGITIVLQREKFRLQGRLFFRSSCCPTV
ncbi:unnamed protein product [Pseudo-nitzschia multistriata]|uniref:Uncharacterized protein n=1 Tax=Pseudo-nitzschia multistriata TaxID=183589 RepID=A0A448ZSV1_9STRA|nr:unnamed protein product [Pseudo-nitzschia multistriata]